MAATYVVNTDRGFTKVVVVVGGGGCISSSSSISEEKRMVPLWNQRHTI
jgi:hypothetical protein